MDHIDIVSRYVGFIPDKMIKNAIDDVSRNGYMTLESIEKYMKNNINKSEFEYEEMQISAKEFIFIDMRVNYNLFMIGNTFYTYETLNLLHPFEQFGKKPEDILTRQNIVLAETKYRTDLGIQDINAKPNELYKILKSTPTQIYIAGKIWEEFIGIINFSNGFKQFVTPMLLAGGSTSIGFLTDILGIPNKLLENSRISQIEDKIENKLKPLMADNEEKEKKIKELEARLAALMPDGP
jgi:hypothetical protein